MSATTTSTTSSTMKTTPTHPVYRADARSSDSVYVVVGSSSSGAVELRPALGAARLQHAANTRLAAVGGGGRGDGVVAGVYIHRFYG